MTNDLFNKSNIKKDENPFNIPEGYFAESRERIMDAIRTEASEKTVMKNYFRSRLVWISGIAASFLIGILLFQNLYIKPKSDNRIAQELDWFINYAGDELNSGLLASYIAEEGIDIGDNSTDKIDEEQSSLLEINDFDEIYIIEEWMKSEK